MSDNEKLKPCPFCGGEATTRMHSVEETWSVSCRDCSAVMPYISVTEAEAIAAWNNRRTPPTDGQQRLDPATVEACAKVAEEKAPTHKYIATAIRALKETNDG